MINETNAKAYCKNYTEIENYQEAINDKTELWVCHHKMEEAFTQRELMRAGWYYDRKASELIFIRQSEHQGNAALHIGIRRYNDVMKGKKRKPFSEEWKKKMSEAQKGKNTWTKGRHWYNNGVECVKAFECPKGFVRGRL